MGPSSSFNSIRSTPERESSTLQETLTIPLFRASRSLGVAKERLGAVKSTRNEEFVQGPHVIPSERRTLQYQSPSSRESACHSVVVEDTVPLECAIVPKDASRLKSIWKETCRSPSGSDELHLSTGVSTATHDSFAGSILGRRRAPSRPLRPVPPKPLDIRSGRYAGRPRCLCHLSAEFR